VAVPPALPADVPVDLTREQAQRLAQLELADPAYRAAQPTLLERAVTWVIDQVQQLVDRVSQASPGGWWGVLGLVVLLVLVAVVVRWRVGPVTRAGTLRFTVDPGTSAAELRARADQAAAAGDWSRAVAERMRAVVRGAQEHGLIDERPGWTADEVAAALGERLPGATPDLARAARVFDDVRYGGRAADAESYAAVSRADRATDRATDPATPR
jgi:Domain of unknown function (DUF4129)